MTSPTHNYHGTTIHLPLPLKTQGEEENSILKTVILEWVAANEELPFYIALGCNLDDVMSSLCWMFWEAEVTCNLVSPWLHPILYEILEGKGIVETPGLYHEILAIMCALRQQRISTLFLGAAVSELIPIMLRRIIRGRSPLDADAFP